MALYQIPIVDSDSKTTETLEEEQAYDFRTRWNTREDAWYCYVGYQSKDPVCKFKLTTGTFDLLKPYKHLDGCPQGRLFMYDVINGFGRPDFDNTGISKRYSLLYMENGTTYDDLV